MIFHFIPDGHDFKKHDSRVDNVRKLGKVILEMKILILKGFFLQDWSSGNLIPCPAGSSQDHFSRPMPGPVQDQF
jgi:hypothetical protein